jgi:hypothetical protein
VRNLFSSFEVSSMAEVYEAIADGFKKPSLRAFIDQARAETVTTNTS